MRTARDLDKLGREFNIVVGIFQLLNAKGSSIGFEPSILFKFIPFLASMSNV
jgi:hypothetical protein